MNTNPLQQYFRRPAVHMRLPSGGKFYDKSVVDIPETGELPVLPMTAIDEITVKTPDALFNGSAMADLIKSCVPAIKNPWLINSIDLDAILIAIRSASGQQELEIETECPSCKQIAPYGINLMSVLSQLRSPDYDTTLQAGELYIKFKPLTYQEVNQIALAQFELQREFAQIENEQDTELRTKKSNEGVKKITDLTMQVLATAIEKIKTPTIEVDDKNFIFDFLKNCDSATYVSIRDRQSDLKTSTEIKPFDVKCVSCGFEFKQPFTLNTSDFFG